MCIVQCNGSGTWHLDVHMRGYGFGETVTGATVQIFRSGVQNVDLRSLGAIVAIGNKSLFLGILMQLYQ